MPSSVGSFLGYLEGGVSYRLSWMRLSYNFSAVFPESRRITYGGNSCVSRDVEYFSECSVDGDASHFRIGDTGMVIL